MLIKFKSFEFWLYGLFSALIGGASTAVAAKIVLPNTIVDFEDFWKLAVSSGVINAVFYLKQSPLPKIESEAQNEKQNPPVTPTVNPPTS